MRQVRDGRGAHVLVGIVLVAGLALWCAACAPPTPPPSLSLDLADGAADVPLDSPLAVTASGAVLDSVTIERRSSHCRTTPRGWLARWRQTPATG